MAFYTPITPPIFEKNISNCLESFNSWSYHVKIDLPAPFCMSLLYTGILHLIYFFLSVKNLASLSLSIWVHLLVCLSHSNLSSFNHISQKALRGSFHLGTHLLIFPYIFFCFSWLCRCWKWSVINFFWSNIYQGLITEMREKYET